MRRLRCEKGRGWLRFFWFFEWVCSCYDANVISLRELRESVSTQQRALLDEIWHHYLIHNEWPIAFEFHSPNRKANVRNTLKPLNGSIVIEVGDSQHGSRYELQLLGALLTSKGENIEKLLVRYLEFLRNRYQNQPKNRTITSAELQTGLHLNDQEIKLLGQLVLLGSLFGSSASHSPNWETWSVGILTEVEEFPPDGGLDGQIEKLAVLKLYKNSPVLLDERRGNPIPTAEFSQALASQVAQPFGGVVLSHADPSTVFVVHGRNGAARKSMFDFLRSIGLKPLEWSAAVRATGEASPYVGQILDKAFSIAQAIVVLMTPDDEASLRKEFQLPHDEHYEKEPTGQARPNVLFEAGMAMGRNPKQTILVELGTLRPFSDVGGRHVLRMNDSMERRQELADRLKTAGCPVNLTGTEWHTVGSFALEDSKALRQLEAAQTQANPLKVSASPPKKLSVHTHWQYAIELEIQNLIQSLSGVKLRLIKIEPPLHADYGTSERFDLDGIEFPLIGARDRVLNKNTKCRVRLFVTELSSGITLRFPVPSVDDHEVVFAPQYENGKLVEHILTLEVSAVGIAALSVKFRMVFQIDNQGPPVKLEEIEF